MAKQASGGTQTVKTHIRTGDVVEVIAGKERGKRGTVLDVDRARGRVTIEGVNFIYRHTRPSQHNQEGGILQREAPLHISNVQIVDPATDRPTRIGMQRNADGSKVRIAKRSGKPLDK